MRKFISGLLAIAAAAFTGCYESGTDADNTSREARISISPAAIGFDADGRTTDGLAFGTYIVTVNPYGKMYSDWHAELVGHRLGHARLPYGLARRRGRKGAADHLLREHGL